MTALYLTSDLVRRFDEAATAYKAVPDALSLLRLNQSALPLLNAAQETPWRPVPESSSGGSTLLACDFSAIRVV
jgi:hypothetical protein